VEELIRCAAAHGRKLTAALIEQTVASNDKQRFALSEDRRRIRANQGHSIEVDLALTPREPPEMLFHGTATRFLASIRAQGLLAGRRQHVHLSADEATAVKVGQRHGEPVVLRIRAGAMHQAGRAFYLSANGVWLTEHVPNEHIEFEP
jgi:putative RNA 2'-phosphotransferase